MSQPGEVINIPDACGGEWEDINEAYDDILEAEQELEQARERLRDEQGFFEEETAGTGAGVLTIGGAIVAGIVTGGLAGIVIGVLGVGAGGGAIIYSEADRQDDIDSAKRDVAAAEDAVREAYEAWDQRVKEFCRCLAAHD